MCTNQNGSFLCPCDENYEYSQVKEICQAKSTFGSAKLVFSGVREIRTLELPDNEKYSSIIQDQKFIQQAIGMYLHNVKTFMIANTFSPVSTLVS